MDLSLLHCTLERGFLLHVWPSDDAPLDSVSESQQFQHVPHLNRPSTLPAADSLEIPHGSLDGMTLQMDVQ